MNARGLVNAPRIAYDARGLVATHGPMTPERIVLHDTESHDAAGIRDLEGIATYWHGVPWGPGAHRIVDRDGNVALCAPDAKIAYHVENHNAGSLGLEIVGFASFLPSVWLLRKTQLEIVARQVAWWSAAYAIPLRLDVDQGVSTHAMQSRAYRGTHTDPGSAFPLDRVLARARELARLALPPPKPKPYERDPFWEWARWRLGEGEFKGRGRDPALRPARAPATVPDEWWRRLGRLVDARNRSEPARGLAKP